MRLLKIIKSPYVRLAVNTAYAVGSCMIGFLYRSWWFITIGSYYAVLATTRFAVLKITRTAHENYNAELSARKFTGYLLIALSVCIAGVNVLSTIKDRSSVFHKITMIAIALYAFAKITIAVVSMVKARHSGCHMTKTLRNISLADACVSLYSMQRSMLVSFPGMGSNDIVLLNILTGTAVFIIVLFLGINLIGGKKITMAKSKIVKANEKIAGAVTDGYKKIEKGVTGGYKKIEKGVVDGYKKIEKGVVDGYKKIEDKFVEAYLVRDGETVEEAKARLKKEQK